MDEYKLKAKTYIEKWQKSLELDDRLEYFEDEFERWIEQIPEEVIPTVIILLDNFEYYSHSVANEWLYKLHKVLLEKYQITNEDTIYTFLKSKDGISNSSNDYWTEYKLINNINRNICYENIFGINKKQWEFINNIVYIDDCSGSGKSFLKELETKENIYQNKNIYFIAIHVMEDAIKKINKFSKNKNINIEVIRAVTQPKAFSPVFFNKNYEVEKTKIIEASKKLGIPKKEILGFKESESLMAFYNNTPNNTLGFLRYDVDNKYKSIFPRVNDKKPSWQRLKQEKINRKARNYNNVVRNVKDV
jgi:hypothetical protein